MQILLSDPTAIDLDALYQVAPELAEEVWDDFTSMPCGDHCREAMMDAHVAECVTCQRELA